MSDLIFALWFFLPAGASNVVPIFINLIPGIGRFNKPLDNGKTWRGKRIFGDNKTWRGLVGGIALGTLTGLVQFTVVSHTVFGKLLPEYINYQSPDVIWFGGLLGFGAIMGDAIESFFKRQRGVNPGESWLFFDQTDYIFGGLLSSLLFVKLSLAVYVLVLVCWASIHLLSTFIGYKLRLKESPL